MIGRVVVLFCCLLGVLPSTPVVVVFGCVWGSYGNNCNLTCQSICSDNKTCDVVTGRCPPEPGRSPTTAVVTAVVLAVSLAIAVVVTTSLVQRMRTKRRQRLRRSGLNSAFPSTEMVRSPDLRNILQREYTNLVNPEFPHHN